jgi:hypothetical protein
MPTPEEIKKQISFVAGRILSIYEEVNSQKRRVISFTMELPEFRSYLEKRLDSISEMVDKGIIPDATGMRQVNETGTVLKEYIAFVNRYSTWLKGNTAIAERINRFEMDNNPKPISDAAHEGKLTFAECLAKFEHILEKFEPIVDEFTSSKDDFNAFETEYREIRHKAEADIN